MRSGGESELRSKRSAIDEVCLARNTEDGTNAIRYDATKIVSTRYRITGCSERRHKTANAISVSAPAALKMTSCISFCGLSQVSIVSTIGPEKYQPSHRKISPFCMKLFITNILHLHYKYLNLRFLDHDQWT